MKRLAAIHPTKRARLLVVSGLVLLALAAGHYGWAATAAVGGIELVAYGLLFVEVDPKGGRR